MAGILDGVDQRTRLAGHNRLELLLFHLGGRQFYGINVFKVQEVIQCPPLTQVPHAHPAVRGIAHLRGKAVTVMDLAMAIGQPPVQSTENAYIIVTEYNRTTQGFLVCGVDRIVNMNWEQILPPPRGAGNNYMTAVTHVDDQLVEIIDVEKVMSEITPINEEVDASLQTAGPSHHVLVVDDSSVARNQVRRTLEQIGVECTLAANGKEALQILREWAADDTLPVTERIGLIVSDIEMPAMDGYTLTTEIRKDERLRDLYIILHTSLSGVFNTNMVKQVGADEFIAKFKPDELAGAVIRRLESLAA